MHYRSATSPYMAGISSRLRGFSSVPAQSRAPEPFYSEEKNYDAPPKRRVERRTGLEPAALRLEV